METEDKLEYLIQTKNWSELTPEEKQLAIEKLGSEEVYQTFRKIETSFIHEGKSDLLPAENVLSSLKKEFRGRYTRVSIFERFVEYRIPAYAAALLALIIVTLAFYAGKQSVNQSIVHVPMVEKDTVYLSAMPDTVYVTKVVYRNVYKTTPPATTSIVKNESSSAEHVTLGVNMKEKEELDNLLVSGTE